MGDRDHPHERSELCHIWLVYSIISYYRQPNCVHSTVLYHLLCVSSIEAVAAHPLVSVRPPSGRLQIGSIHQPTYKWDISIFKQQYIVGRQATVYYYFASRDTQNPSIANIGNLFYFLRRRKAQLNYSLRSGLSSLLLNLVWNATWSYVECIRSTDRHAKL